MWVFCLGHVPLYDFSAENVQSDVKAELDRQKTLKKCVI